MAQSDGVRKKHAVGDRTHPRNPDHAGAHRRVNRIGRRDGGCKIVLPARKSHQRAAEPAICDGGREGRYGQHPALAEVAVGIVDDSLRHRQNRRKLPNFQPDGHRRDNKSDRQCRVADGVEQPGEFIREV